MMKLFAGLLVLAALAMGAAMVIGGRVPMADKPTPSPATRVLSPSDTFVIHDAPPAAAPAAPAAPATPAPADPNATPTPGALDAAIDRLRTANPSDPTVPAPDATVTITPGATPTPAPSTPDPLLAGPNPAPSVLAGPPPPPPPPNWTAVTSQGVRWRGNPNSLVIDMGGGRTATVMVDPAFAALPQEAANTRVDFLKQTILENFPPGSNQFRFARDGSVALLR